MPKRYVITSRPVIANDGRLLGWSQRYSDGTSAFIQRKRVTKGHCVNYGPQWAKGQ